jgi:hypothetical protein
MIDIVKITLPALLVLITAFFVLDRQQKAEIQRRQLDTKEKNSSTTLPIRLRAYERLMLVLERTIPNYLIINTIKSEMSSIELQTQLIAAIRQEFSHNVSQQIYVSNDLWSAFRMAQESLIQLVNSCAARLQSDGDATQLAEYIIQVYNSTDELPSENAISLLKAEVRILM